MPIITSPDVIEQSDFSFGIDLQGADASVDSAALLDDLNMILDPNTGSLVTRGGFQRNFNLTGLTDLDNGHYVLQVFPFQAPGGSKLVVIVSDGSASADNVGLILVDLEAGTWARMDTAGVTWPQPTEHHWGVGMDGIWYGGTQGVEMYSYTVGTATWDASAGIPAYKELVDDVNDSVTVASEYGRDYSFKGKEIVSWDGNYYKPARSIRFDEFDNDEKFYQVGDKVSREWVWASTTIYWKSFKCIKKHDPSVVDADPGSGADWRDYWTKVRLPFPTNTAGAEQETSNSWVYVPVASETHIATWHASRMWLRFDDEKDRSRLQFSAPIKPDKGEDVPDVTWTPDFAPSATNEGQGGGWLAFNDGTHHGFITALRSYGDRLLVFKRQAVWALVGTDDTTWQPKRIIEHIGCVGPKSHVLIDGIVWFLSDEGLYMTDGQEAREAPGNERVRDFIRDRLDESQFVQSTGVRRVDQYPTMWVWDDFIWISMPSVETTAAKSVTLVYHPKTASWYYTNLPVRDAAIYRNTGRTHLALALSPFYGEVDNAGNYARIYEYKKGLTTDTDGAASEGTSEIAWLVRFGWLSFATLRQQRRIRRAWALIKSGASQTITILARKDYSDSTAKSTTRAVTSGGGVQHIEGEVFADSHAISYQLSGTKAPATVFGWAVHTQRRRDMRYHNGPGPV